MRRPFLVLVAGASLAGCVSDAGGSIRFEGALYRPLIGRELRTAIVGKILTFPEPQRGPIVIVSGGRCHIFRPRGEYTACGDRAPFIPGTYVLHRDRVCATLLHSGHTSCWMLYAGGTGDYVLRTVSPDASVPPERVRIEPWPR